MRSLHVFLAEADLSEYLSPLITQLKVSTVEHLKYVHEEDLESIGMTRPEIRRLKKFHKKEFTFGAMEKLKKLQAIMKGGGDGASKSRGPATTIPGVPRPPSASALYKRPLGMITELGKTAIMKGGGDGASKSHGPATTIPGGPRPSSASAPYKSPPGKITELGKTAIMKGGGDGASKSRGPATTIPGGPRPPSASAPYKRPLGMITELGKTSSFDFGPSFRALDEKEKQAGSSMSVTPTSNQGHFRDSNFCISPSRSEPPVPAPREIQTSLSPATAPPPPPLPPRVVSGCYFNHRQQQQSARSSPFNTNSPATRTLDRSFSTETKAPSMYLDVSNNQSLPANLPPAPPIPSFHEKSGLEHHRPNTMRSISHTSDTFLRGPNFLTVDSSSSSQAFFRGRLASTNPRSSHGHRTEICSTPPSRNSSHRLPYYSHEISDDDDDTYLAEAPHRYSQSPFHPLVSARESPQMTDIYSSVSFLQSPSDISPHQISSAISPHGHSSKSFETAPPPPATRRSADNHNADPHTDSYVVMKPTNFMSHKLEGSSLTRQHLTSPSTTSQIFKFPSTIRSEDSFALSSTLSPAATQSSLEYPSSSEVSSLMFANCHATYNVSNEDLHQFAFDRRNNCEEIEILLKMFLDEVTVDECMTALEGARWDVSQASKYLKLKRLLSLGIADVHTCKEALSANGWDLQTAAETLIE